MVTEGQYGEGPAGSFQRAEVLAPGRHRIFRNRKTYLIGGLFLVVVVAYFATTSFLHSNSVKNVTRIQGKVAMTQQDLQDVVKARHLTVYWAGPVAGDKYALVSQKAGEAFVRYLPKGLGLADTTSTFRIIATYIQKGAFLTTRTAGTQVGNVGFTNVDGNTVFYVKTRPTNVYVGIRDKDVQLEIFDPDIDQALAIALFHGQIQLIN